MFNFFENKKITEKLYEQNLELAVKNKTLSLLETLYQTSVLTLAPEEMAKKITDIIQKDLNLEFTGIFNFDKQSDSLNSLALSQSERLDKILSGLNLLSDKLKVENIKNHNLFKQVVYEKTPVITKDVEEALINIVDQKDAQEIKNSSNIKTVLIYSLDMDKEVLGVLVMAFNRDYDTLSAFEKSSIKSFINIIALLLNKAYLYKNLQISYEVEKQAHVIEKKAKEELEKIDKFKDQFLMTTQHNLRTPLTSMMGYSDLLVNGVFGKQNKKTTEVIKKIPKFNQRNDTYGK